MHTPIPRIHTYINMHTHMHTAYTPCIYIHKHAYTYLYVCMALQVIMHVCLHYVCAYGVYAYIRIHTHTYVYIRIHTYTYVYIRVLLLNPYAGYFDHPYECEGKIAPNACVPRVYINIYIYIQLNACVPRARIMCIHASMYDIAFCTFTLAMSYIDVHYMCASHISTLHMTLVCIYSI